jgi:hypothetical protein
MFFVGLFKVQVNRCSAFAADPVTKCEQSHIVTLSTILALNGHMIRLER